MKMAEGSKDQGGTASSEPEEDSPNMIVYRKARLPLCPNYSVLSISDVRNIHCIQINVSAGVCIRVHLPHTSFSVRCQEDFLSTILKGAPLSLFLPSGPSVSF